MRYIKQSIILTLVFYTISCNNSSDKTTNAKDSVISEGLDSSKQSYTDSLPPDLIDLRFCTEKLPYPKKEFKRLYDVDTVVFMNKQNQRDTMLKPVHGQEKPYISSLNGYVWNKNILNVKFLDGDPNVQARVRESVKEWEKSCAVRFNFGNFVDPDITISFQNEGFWSNIGSDSKGRYPSMSLTGVSINMSEDDFNSVVLHEFGHALGFVHEHQTPGFNIPWDVDRVERYYRIRYGWDPKMVYDNVIFKYEFNEVNGTAFDSKSIMVYAIPKGLTVDRSFSVDWTYKLSENDKKIVAQRYR